MTTDRRQGNRWPYRDRVLYRAKTAHGEGALCNVSETGVFVRTDTTPQVGEDVEIVLKRAHPPLALNARTCWVGRRSDGARGFGATLVDPPEPYVELVRSLELSQEADGPRRVAPRTPTCFSVAVQHEDACDEGVLSDLSMTGARLHKTGIRPEIGSLVSLFFTLGGSERPFEIAAHVVRVADRGGYAVQFETLEPDLKIALERAIRALAAPAS